MAPQTLRRLATTVTITVDPANWTNVPIVDDRHNCAKKTILLTTAISVPIPRICPFVFHPVNWSNYSLERNSIDIWRKIIEHTWFDVWYCEISKYGIVNNVE